jgi:hypothetical protein
LEEEAKSIKGDLNNVLKDYTSKIVFTHNSWYSMRDRCLNPKSKDYPNWGGRGVEICERWGVFENFLDDMGFRPEGHTIGRMDNDGDYCPDNCKWETYKQQQRNKRNTNWITRDGETKSVSTWSEETGIHRDTLASRKRRGCDIDRIFGEKFAKQPSKIDYSVFIGEPFGHLTILSIPELTDEKYRRMARCRCVCGYEKDYNLYSVLSGGARSCGCKGAAPVSVHTIKPGDRFNKWTVNEVFYETNKIGNKVQYCNATCDCGTKRTVNSFTLRAEKSHSCINCANIKHGGSAKDSVVAREYQAWESMRGRCHSPSASGYKSNGAVGIGVCKQWDSFDTFLADMGERPTDKPYLCRKNNRADYTPENCFWGTKKDLGPSTRANFVTHDGVTMTLMEWSRKLGIHYNTLRKRYITHGSLLGATA